MSATTADGLLAGIPTQRGPGHDAPVPPRAPGHRDQYVDVLRALALVRVVTYHTFGWAWLPVVYPSMGVMFALGGSLVAVSLTRPGARPLTVLHKRLRRLLPPLWLYGVVLVPLMAWHGWTVSASAGTPVDLRAALAWLVPFEQPSGSAWGADWVLPLWYVRTYLWLLLLSPALLWIYRRHPRLTVAGPFALLALLVSGILQAGPGTADTLEHIGMFGGCWLLGFAHQQGQLTRLARTPALLAGGALMLAGLAWALTHSLPGTGWDIDDIPVADALYCTGAVLVLLRLYPRRPMPARTRFLGGLVAAMNARAMTIYLWGNLSIWAATPLLETTRWTTRLEGPGWVGGLAEYSVAWLVLVVIVVAVGWVEDVAAGRPPRLNPWPRGKEELPPTELARRHPLARRLPHRGVIAVLGAALVVAVGGALVGPPGHAVPPPPLHAASRFPGVTAQREYPEHAGVRAALVRIGAVTAEGEGGQSLRSGWDGAWASHYGGCDGVGTVGARCRSDLGQRHAPDWFPTAMTPRENPYYVGLPYNDLGAEADRGALAWGADPGYAGRTGDRRFSFLKNRWVAVAVRNDFCYAQVEDTGPGVSDPAYVAGSAPPSRAPSITLSPAIVGCLGLTGDRPLTVSWRFVDAPPDGPWTRVVTTRQVDSSGGS
jgi:hypothetical protein